MRLIAKYRKFCLYTDATEYLMTGHGSDHRIQNDPNDSRRIVEHWRGYTGNHDLEIAPHCGAPINMTEIRAALNLLRLDVADLNKEIVADCGGFMQSRGIRVATTLEDGSGSCVDEGPMPTRKEIKSSDIGYGVYLETGYNLLMFVGDENYEPCPETYRDLVIKFVDDKMIIAN